jgi:hypothetical protein
MAGRELPGGERAAAWPGLRLVRTTRGVTPTGGDTGGPAPPVGAELIVETEGDSFPQHQSTLKAPGQRNRVSRALHISPMRANGRVDFVRADFCAC